MTYLHVRRLCCLLIPGSLLAVALAAQAQQFDPPYPPTSADPGAVEPFPESPGTGPAIPGMPPAWSPQRTITNRSGTVRNTHQQTTSEDGSQQLREHVVENPRGEMVQSWERSQTDDGYLYRRSQTFTAPDGTLLRQHESSVSGTDPYNYTRQNQNTLRDGRTILHSQTRTWDGTTGTMERTFSGPNGQTLESQRPWTPDDTWSAEGGAPRGESVPPQPAATQPPAAYGFGAVSPPAERPQEKKLGWAEKLNPFRKGGLFRPNKKPPSSPPRSSGFTMGSSGQSGAGRVPSGLSRRQPGEPSPNSHRPPWAGHSSSSSPPHQTGMASTTRPGQGRNR